MAFDFKKQYKEIYSPKLVPEILTINKMNEHLFNNGYEADFSDVRRHHEIYLSDPRKCAKEKLKTIIRHPIKKI